MTRVRGPRLTHEISRRPPRLSRAYLAETYDGIGQDVKVQMSRGAITSAFRARIAAGDFGGGRTFPVGTPVVVFSNRGQLEVLSLGNRPGACDLFNGSTDEPAGGWGTGRYGPWLSDIGMIELTDTSPYTEQDHWVQDGTAIMRYSNAGFNSIGLGPAMGVKFADGLDLPIEVRYLYYIDGPVPASNDYRNLQVYMGPYYYGDVNAWLAISQFYDNSTHETVGTANFASNGGYVFGIDTSPGKNYPETLLEAQEHRWVAARVDSSGVHVKSWREEEGEPTDWDFTNLWTGAVPSSSSFRYIYLETQSFFSPFIGNEQPKCHIETFCVNELPK